MGAASHGRALPCRAAAQSEELRAKLWDAGKNCKSRLFHPATRLFSCLVFLGAAQAFLIQLRAVIRAKTKPGTVSVPGTGDLESHKRLLGEG